MTTDISMNALTTAREAAKLAAVVREVFAGLDMIEYAGTNYDGKDVTMGEQAHAIVTVGAAVGREMRQRLHERIAQTAWQLVKWEIAPHVRQSDEDGPIVWLTGNAYMPPMRSFVPAEVIWQCDDGGDIWQMFVEEFERVCLEENIYVGAPDYDNALYGVDMRVWETTDQEGDTISSDWQRKSNDNNGDAA